jgi:hypothetical protein
MSSGPLATGSRAWPTLRQRLWHPSIPKRKRKPRPLKSGEAELLQLLGEYPREPRDIGEISRELVPRWF